MLCFNASMETPCFLNEDPNECSFTPVGTSFIDITLAGDKIANTSWSYLDFPSLSDHPYITFNFSLFSPSRPKLRTQHAQHRAPKLQQITIEPLLHRLSTSICSADLPLTTRDQTKNSNSKLSHLITDCAIRSKIKADKTVSHSPTMPWWNDELTNLRQQTRKAYRKWCKN